MNTLTFFVALFILLLGFSSFANAHMEFESPKSRGHEEDTMSQAPCGGYNDTSAVVDFPVTGQVTIGFDDVEDDDGVLAINYAPNINATFMPVSENVTIDIDDDDEKAFTVPVDLSKAGAKVGEKGVIQAIYNGEEIWYQCADINVVEAKKSGASSFVGTSEVTYLIMVLATFVMALN